MKKFSIFVLAFFGCIATYAQQPASFFDDWGNIRLETKELQESADTLVSLFHRSDDVVWSRVVYRIVDMRYKQNYQLYTPVIATDPMYSSLFRTMLRAIEDDMPIFAKSFTQGDVRPYFNEGPIAKSDVPTLLNTDVTGEGDSDISKSANMLLNYDKDADKLFFNFSPYYEGFVRNQLKFMIQEVVFFDRHYSRLYSKIMAIAPMHTPESVEGMSPMDALYQQILFWVRYDDFRPYMAQQYVTPRGNDSKRVTFDDFFSLKLYSSYVVGVNNMYSRMIPEIAHTYEQVQHEQQKIETDLLKVEQDLWEY
jgi:gliding motility associated protien GldN